MNSQQYEAVICALECGTLSKAAEELGYTQSGISRLINALEEDLGFKLLLRGRGGVSLTAEGELTLPHIRESLYSQQRLTELAAEINGLRSGLIRLGTFNSVSAQWLPGMIKSFTANYPDVRFELTHGTNAQTYALLESGRIDLNFTDYGTHAEFDEIFMVSDPIVAVFSASDKHAKRRSFSLSELKNLPYISLNEGVDDEITRILAENNLDIVPRYIESDDHAVIAMVEQALGTSLMPLMSTMGFSRKIVALPLDPPVHRKIGLACRDRDMLSLAGRAFLEHAERWIEEKYGKKRVVSA